MSIEYPSNIGEVVARERTDVKSALPDSNPFQIRNSFLNALVVGTAGRAFDLYNQIQAVQSEMFMDTATGEFLERWGSYKKITRNAASQSEGNITVTGTSTTNIPAGTALQSTEGIQYLTLNDEQITSVPISVLTITRSSQIMTVTTSGTHHYGDGMTVVISGANESEYNGSFVVNTTAVNSFTATVVGTPATPATGTIISTATLADTEVKSVTFGADTDQVKGTEISFVTPVSGADNNAIVQFEGLAGGEDIESDSDLRNRIISEYQNPISTFNAAAIESKAKEVAGVTTVEVHEITPDVGQVNIYLLRYNDDPVIPSASDVATVKKEILTIKPAHVDPEDVKVLAPAGITQDFVFNSLDPNTASMQTSIEASLVEAFRENALVGEDFQKIAYESAIWQTVDTSNGDSVVSFHLNIPGGDIVVASGEIAVLGTVTFT